MLRGGLAGDGAVALLPLMVGGAVHGAGRLQVGALDECRIDTFGPGAVRHAVQIASVVEHVELVVDIVAQFAVFAVGGDLRLDGDVGLFQKRHDLSDVGAGVAGLDIDHLVEQRFADAEDLVGGHLDRGVFGDALGKRDGRRIHDVDAGDALGKNSMKGQKARMDVGLRHERTSSFHLRGQSPKSQYLNPAYQICQ